MNIAKIENLRKHNFIKSLLLQYFMAFIIRNLPHCIKNFFQVLSHKFFNILKHFNMLITFQRFKIFKKWGQKMKIFF